jgi:hypothetical protein
MKIDTPKTEPEFGGIALARTPEWVVRDLWQSGKISDEDYSSELFRRAKKASATQDRIEQLEAVLAEAEAVMSKNIQPKPDVGPDHPWAVLQRVRAALKEQADA